MYGDSAGDAVPLGELLGLARDEGLTALEARVDQVPSDANGRVAVVTAMARSAAASFSAIGEASPASAPADWHPFLTTLADIRAKARVLRELTGLDHPVRDELDVPYTSEGEGQADVSPAPPPLRSVTAVPPSTSDLPTAPRLVSGARNVDEDEEPDNEDQVPVFRTASPPPGTGDEDEALYDGLPADMLAKLRKLTISIASLEGSDITEEEADVKLDNFFQRAFKHPLSRATRMEGQRVVQRLSSELSQRRATSEQE